MPNVKSPEQTTLIDSTPAEHRRFWFLLVCLLVGMVSGHFAMKIILGHTQVDLLDGLMGASLGYWFAWVCK